jgi:methyl-accepting chemotaxis protein
MMLNSKKQNGRLNSRSIRTKLIWLIILLIVLSITATKIYDYNVRVPEIEKTVREERFNVAVLTAARLETEIFETISVLETAAHNTVFASNDRDATVKALLAIKEQNLIFSTVFLCDASLSRINEKGETTSLASREYMQETKKMKKTVISHEILISQATKKPSIMIATPVKVPGAPERYLGISINIDNLQAIVDQTQKSGSNYSFAFDGKSGLVFAHPAQENIGSLKLIHPDEKDRAKVAPELQSMAKEAVAGHSGTQIYDFDGSRVIAAYTNIPGTSFGVATRMNYYDAMAPVRKERNSALIITLLASLISAIITLTFARFIIDKPLNSIASRIAEGAGQVVVASNQLAASAQHLSQDSMEQAAAIEEISSTIQETASMASQNTSNTEQAAQLSEQAKESANQGGLEMREMMQSIQEIKSSSDQIVKIIKVIDDIAFQTNILALNAAIEAARAGEAGMGFAVVAEEVRNLAGRSAQAARDTTAMIEANIELSSKGVAAAEKVRAALDEITVQSNKVSQLMDEVAAASQEQVQGIDQVNKAMTQVETVTQQNAASAEESASAAAELNAQAESMRQIILEFSELVNGTAASLEAELKRAETQGSLAPHNRTVRPLKTAPQSQAQLETAAKRTRVVAPEEVIPLNQDPHQF